MRPIGCPTIYNRGPAIRIQPKHADLWTTPQSPRSPHRPGRAASAWSGSAEPRRRQSRAESFGGGGTVATADLKKIASHRLLYGRVIDPGEWGDDRRGAARLDGGAAHLYLRGHGRADLSRRSGAAAGNAAGRACRRRAPGRTGRIHPARVSQRPPRSHPGGSSAERRLGPNRGGIAAGGRRSQRQPHPPPQAGP